MRAKPRDAEGDAPYAGAVPKALLLAWQIATDYGIGWFVARAIHEIALRIGLTALRFPRRPWKTNELGRWLLPGVPSGADEYADYRAQRPHPFFVGSRECVAPTLRRLLGDDGVTQLANEATSVADGNIRYFSGAEARVFPDPGWHANAATGQRFTGDTHWTRIDVYSKAHTDIKFVWEPGRFSSAYVLARAYWVTDDERFPEAFWSMAEDWCHRNPPNTGPHWMDGQEIALRLMAWCFALHAFEDSPATTPERIRMLVGAIAAQADRIARAHAYARLQRNNHAISEGVGLWTVGLLFPEFRNAPRWRKQGRRILVDESARQIATDGSYIQNSTNYHRVMLDDYLWALRIGEACGDSLPAQVSDAVSRGLDFLLALQDEGTGAVPNYGNNDGALVLPLSTCKYRDFRPALAAGFAVTQGRRIYGPGPWDEQVLWLSGTEVLGIEPESTKAKSLAARAGGYYTLRGERGYALVRCHTHKQRPGHADLLHVDLWHDGLNLACDPGTYRYYDAAPWEGGLAATGVHNTVAIAGQDQMVRGPRFLWLKWAKALELANEHGTGGQLEVFQGEHRGYRRLTPRLTHRRTLIRGGDHAWVVIDDLIGSGVQQAALHWLLDPNTYAPSLVGRSLRLNVSGEPGVHWRCDSVDNEQADVVSGGNISDTRGWRSPTYGVLEPALSLMVRGTAQLPARFTSVFVMDGAKVASLDEYGAEINFGDDECLKVRFGQPSNAGTPVDIQLSRASVEVDRLTIGAS